MEKKKLISISKLPKISKPIRGVMYSRLVYKIWSESLSFENLNIFVTKNFPTKYRYI